MHGWSWNGTCVKDCPIGYIKYSDGEDITCEITRNLSYVRKVGKYVVLTLSLSLQKWIKIQISLHNKEVKIW